LNEELTLHIKKLQRRATLSLIAILSAIVSIGFGILFLFVPSFIAIIFFVITTICIVYLIRSNRTAKKETKENIYKPVIFNSSLYKLTSISYETGGYRYIFDEVTNNDYHDFLWINVNNEKIPQLQEYFEKHKQKWLNHDERYFSATVDGIEYACFHNSSDQTYVSWQQFGKYHTAYVAPGYFERIEEVLPLLKLEAVKLRTDTVTQ
jgi:hypothetical protein